MMTNDHFWQIIADNCTNGPDCDDWDVRLTVALSKLPAEVIVEWNHIFDNLAKQAYRNDLWAAAYLINGGASDDGFYYFRCWLIGMGKSVYENAIADPDNLADVVSPEMLEAEAEIYAAAHQAWMQVTGNDYEADYPARNESAELVGEDWDFDDEQLCRQKIPRLFAKFGSKNWGIDSE